ncbi:hypothetical protein [Paraliobacillus zengyii]|nr:hypothetical protein [Paraliobacillus zengyii]
MDIFLTGVDKNKDCIENKQWGHVSYKKWYNEKNILYIRKLGNDGEEKK